MANKESIHFKATLKRPDRVIDCWLIERPQNEAHLVDSLLAWSVSVGPLNKTVPAVIIFGDSVVDTGNNDYITTIIKCDFSPYGKDFEGGIPTGRFSNGKVPADFIAALFGVKDLMPSYLEPNLQLRDFLTGVSFASGGAGYDPFTSKFVNALSMDDQIDMFKEYIELVKAAVGKERLATMLSKSIFISVFGSNDIANTLSNPIRRLQYDVDQYIDLLVNSASEFYQKLYALGARRIGVFSSPPIGCVPLKRTVKGGIRRDCSESVNNASILFNTKLSSMINSLNKQHHDFRLVYLDIFNTLLSLIQTPAKYGFEVSSKGCCGPGTLPAGFLCNALVEDFLCNDTSKYVFWDTFHPTETAYKILNTLVFTKDTISKFF
ncbi:GDSL esterase/lipase EXL3-like [Tripterygium wilfordii]|nr:GDSL esterase/lipase EXL3-like [Tripterygium wilfordii]